MDDYGGYNPSNASLGLWQCRVFTTKTESKLKRAWFELLLFDKKIVATGHAYFGVFTKYYTLCTLFFIGIIESLRNLITLILRIVDPKCSFRMLKMGRREYNLPIHGWFKWDSHGLNVDNSSHSFHGIVGVVSWDAKTNPSWQRLGGFPSLQGPDG